MVHPAPRRADSPPPESGFGAATYSCHAGTDMRRRPGPRRRPMQPQACSVGSSCQKPCCCGPPVEMDETSTLASCLVHALHPLHRSPQISIVAFKLLQPWSETCWAMCVNSFFFPFLSGCSVLVLRTGGELMMQGQRHKCPPHSEDAGAPQVRHVPLGDCTALLGYACNSCHKRMTSPRKAGPAPMRRPRAARRQTTHSNVRLPRDTARQRARGASPDGRLSTAQQATHAGDPAAPRQQFGEQHSRSWAAWRAARARCEMQGTPARLLASARQDTAWRAAHAATRPRGRRDRSPRCRRPRLPRGSRARPQARRRATLDARAHRPAPCASRPRPRLQKLIAAPERAAWLEPRPQARACSAS